MYLKYSKRVPIEQDYYMSRIKSAIGHEEFQKFCESNGVHHNFSSPRTLAQNRLWKERIELSKRWLGPYYVKTLYQSIYV